MIVAIVNNTAPLSTIDNIEDNIGCKVSEKPACSKANPTYGTNLFTTLKSTHRIYAARNIFDKKNTALSIANCM